ncbi:MAG: sulfite exporter TauE/SafE family protein [Chloroflexi bacterium]|nr:MAG: sulfite exporter TauE/SafE family protein [Chloroflexota bacterium]
MADTVIELLPEVVLLLAAAFAASIVAAVAGFGGAAILLPVLVALFGPRDAIPILAVAGLVSNGSRVALNRDEISWHIVGWFALGGIPAALIGGFLFAAAPLEALTRLIGAFLLASVAWRHLRPRPSGVLGPRTFTVIGAVFAFASALVGSIGPIMAPFFLAAGLVKSAYIGTEAAASVVMQVAKLVAYGIAAILTPFMGALGLLMVPTMLAGSWIGKRIVDRMSERIFIAVIEVVLVVTGLIFLIGG